VAGSWAWRVFAGPRRADPYVSDLETTDVDPVLIPGGVAEPNGIRFHAAVIDCSALRQAIDDPRPAVAGAAKETATEIVARRSPRKP